MTATPPSRRIGVRALPVLLLAGLCTTTIACSDDAREDPVFGSGDPASDAPGSTAGPILSSETLGSEDCDPIHRGHCAMPWPSNLYLHEAPERGTGFELRFGETTLPANNRGEHIDPAPYRRMDGYSPGTPLILFWPDLDFAESGLARQDNLESSIAEDAPIIWLRVDDDGVVERVPYFAEVDVYPDTGANERALFVRPAVILEEGARYVVGVRGLRNTDGQAIAPEPAFEALRDGRTAGMPTLASRQERFDDLLGILEDYGVPRDEWIVAWDFVTASTDGLHGPMLRMRDRALELMPDGAEIEITSVRRFLAEADPERPELDVSDENFLHIEAQYRSPLFMRRATLGGADNPAWVFNLDADGQVVEARDDQGELLYSENRIWILIPRSAEAGATQGLMLYGHGLLGTGGQTLGGYNRRIANDHNYIYFGISMLGMSSEDLDTVFGLLANLSRFPYLADRLHQGVIDSVMVGRGVRNALPDLLPVALEASGVFSEDEEIPTIAIDTDDLVYSGISQGGIFGATVVAVSPDITRGHLGVPGNNYSTLLHRSSNFGVYFIVMRGSYRSAVDRAIVLSTIQLLWDGTDPVSYVRRASGSPFPNTPQSSILLVPVKGDWQVEVQTNEFAARSNMGIALMENYDREREPWGITPTPYPHVGSGVVLWDYGNPWPAASRNVPPNDAFGDPHGAPRNDREHGRQLAHFLRTGEIIDVCEGAPCMRGAALEQ